MISGDARRKKKERAPRKKAVPPVRRGDEPMTADFLRSEQCETVAAVSRRLWSPELFCRLFAESDSAGRRRLRLAVLAGTQGRCRQQGFDPGVMLEEKEPLGEAGEGPAAVHLAACDTLDCVRWLRERGHKQVSCLVMASRSQLGGGFERGAGAQEEHIYRSTSLSLLHDKGAALATELSVFQFDRCPILRSSERHGYRHLARPVRAHFVSMAGVAHPQTEGERMDRASSKLLEAKLVRLLQCVPSGAALVLGAWGCGAYACPPLHVAEIFKSVLARHGAGRLVYFALLPRGRKALNNLRDFESVFKQAAVEMAPLEERTRAALAFLLVYTFRRPECMWGMPKEVAAAIARFVLADA